MVCLRRRERNKVTAMNEKADDLIPDAVVKLVFEDRMPVAVAWRMHLRLTQGEVAQRLGVSERVYAKIEGGSMSCEATRERIADALGIRAGQLDF